MTCHCNAFEKTRWRSEVLQKLQAKEPDAFDTFDKSKFCIYTDGKGCLVKRHVYV